MLVLISLSTSCFFVSLFSKSAMVILMLFRSYCEYDIVSFFFFLCYLLVFFIIESASYICSILSECSSVGWWQWRWFYSFSKIVLFLLAKLQDQVEMASIKGSEYSIEQGLYSLSLFYPARSNIDSIPRSDSLFSRLYDSSSSSSSNCSSNSCSPSSCSSCSSSSA
jgi:hypothetical protein